MFFSKAILAIFKYIMFCNKIIQPSMNQFFKHFVNMCEHRYRTIVFFNFFFSRGASQPPDSLTLRHVG